MITLCLSFSSTICVYTLCRHEIDTDLVKRAGRIVVDQKTACLVRRLIMIVARRTLSIMMRTPQQEAGELISAGLTASCLVEIGQLYDWDAIASSWTARTDVIRDVRSGGDITIFKSVGVGIQDVAIACAVVDRAMQEGVGRTIEDYDTEI